MKDKSVSSLENKNMKNEYPVKGKFYRVVSGPYKGFIGECVGVDLSSDLPVILEDMDFRAKVLRTLFNLAHLIP